MLSALRVTALIRYQKLHKSENHEVSGRKYCFWEEENYYKRPSRKIVDIRTPPTQVTGSHSQDTRI